MFFFLNKELNFIPNHTFCHLQEFDLNKVSEWLENDDEKSELLKFIDEIKAISNKKSSIENPLLIKSSNATDVIKNASYDELLLFDEILSAEINKTAINQDNNNIVMDRTNKTSKIIKGNNKQLTQSQEWDSQRQESNKIEEEPVLRPAEKESTPKTFDPQHLIERIRKINHRPYVTSNYELLSCKSQSFLQRLAVLGEILT